VSSCVGHNLIGVASTSRVGDLPGYGGRGRYAAMEPLRARGAASCRSSSRATRRTSVPAWSTPQNRWPCGRGRAELRVETGLNELPGLGSGTARDRSEVVRSIERFTQRVLVDGLLRHQLDPSGTPRSALQVRRPSSSARVVGPGSPDYKIPLGPRCRISADLRDPPCGIPPGPGVRGHPPIAHSGRTCAFGRP
jgi:hypothetical protein